MHRDMKRTLAIMLSLASCTVPIRQIQHAGGKTVTQDGRCRDLAPTPEPATCTDGKRMNSVVFALVLVGSVALVAVGGIVVQAETHVHVMPL
jgi:hypothetical protein